MSRTITRLFDTYADAERAVAELERLGVPHRDISLVANNTHGAHDHHGGFTSEDGHTTGDHAAADAGKGAATGGVVGGVGGLLAGLGLLAIPGLGPVVAAGWLAATVVGAGVGAAAGGAVGGLVGALTHAGETPENAEVYAEGVRRGGTLVSVKAHDDQAAAVEAALHNYNAITAETRGGAYREAGWSRFDDTALPYTAEQVDAERNRYQVV